MTRTGFIAIVGKPNVGKSTLLNTILGEKVAIVSKKPQTTRTRITGILTEGEDQTVFLDTPGTHLPKTKLGEAMMRAVNDTVTPGACDAALLVVDAADKPKQVELAIIEKIKKAKLPCILVLNKTDTVNAERIGAAILEYSVLYDFDDVVPISAMKNDGVDIIKEDCKKYLYEGPWYFPDDEITDQPERQIAAEIIREKLLRILDDEIPHGTAVVIEEFKDGGKCLRIRAEIFCEKESHKGIIIGKKGAMLKTIGTYAREDMEEFFGTQVYLNLWVKVKENWRDSVSTINNFGLSNKDI